MVEMRLSTEKGLAKDTCDAQRRLQMIDEQELMIWVYMGNDLHY